MCLNLKVPYMNRDVKSHGCEPTQCHWSCTHPLLLCALMCPWSINGSCFGICWLIQRLIEIYENIYFFSVKWFQWCPHSILCYTINCLYKCVMHLSFFIPKKEGYIFFIFPQQNAAKILVHPETEFSFLDVWMYITPFSWSKHNI